MYPIGIPLLYASILWKNRAALNPPGEDTADSSSSKFRLLAMGGYSAKESVEELEQKLEKRKQNPDLVPSMFLWKDFGERVCFGCKFFKRHRCVASLFPSMFTSTLVKCVSFSATNAYGRSESERLVCDRLFECVRTLIYAPSMRQPRHVR